MSCRARRQWSGEVDERVGVGIYGTYECGGFPFGGSASLGVDAPEAVLVGHYHFVGAYYVDVLEAVDYSVFE